MGVTVWLLILAAVVLVAAVPFGIIWSLNTLFALSIPVTPKTWAAALILGGIVAGHTARREK